MGSKSLAGEASRPPAAERSREGATGRVCRRHGALYPDDGLRFRADTAGIPRPVRRRGRGARRRRSAAVSRTSRCSSITLFSRFSAIGVSHLLANLMLSRSTLRDISNNLKLYRAEILKGLEIEQDCTSPPM